MVDEKEITDKYGVNTVTFHVDKKEKEYHVVLKGGKTVEATHNVPFLRLLDLIECPTELQDFENRLGVCWDSEKEVVVV